MVFATPANVTDLSVAKASPFPSLIEVTTEELVTGLESAQFSSVDLVNVHRPTMPPNVPEERSH